MATIIISKEVVTRMTKLTLSKQTARRLAATKYNRWTRRFEILRKQWLSLVELDDFLVDDSNKLIKEGEAILNLMGPEFEP